MHQPSTNTLAANLRCEFQLLLAGARTVLNSIQAERIENLLHRELDWPYLIETAFQHGLAPLLYRNLNGSFRQAVPKRVLGQLQSHFHANTLHNLALTRTLFDLLDKFQARGIPVIPFKGPVLAAAVYGDLSLRQFTDLDVLVHQRDVPRACALLIEEGYNLLNTNSRPNACRSRSTEEYHYTFTHADGPCPVELHWAFTPKHFSWPCDIAGLWERLEPVSLAGKSARTLAPEDLLPILCVHGAKHCWERLEWICGVAELIRVAQARDWKRVSSKRLEPVRNESSCWACCSPEICSTPKFPSTPHAGWRPIRWFERSPSGCVTGYSTPPNLPAASPDTPFFCRRGNANEIGFATFPIILRQVNERDRAVLPLPGLLYYLLRPLRLLARHGNPWRFGQS